MISLQLNSTYINPYQEILPNVMNEKEGEAIREMLSWYSPNGPIRHSTIYNGGTGVSQTVIVNSNHWDIDQVIRQLVGFPSLNLSLNCSVTAGGKGFELPSSFLSDLGESIERMSGVFAFLKEDLEICAGSYSSLQKIGQNAIEPEALPLFADEQYTSPDFFFQPFTRESEFNWVKGRRLISQEDIWIPLQLVLFFYIPSIKESRIGYSSSSGMASHIDEALAIIAGVTELVERDALMLSWYTNVPLRRIEVDKPLSSKKSNRALEHIRSLSGDVNFWLHDVGFPKLPCISAVQLVSYYKKFAYQAGSATALDGEEAFTQALLEYGQAELHLKCAMLAPQRQFTRDVQAVFDAPSNKPMAEMHTFLETIGYYGHVEHAGRLKDFFRSDDTVSLLELPKVKFKHSEEQLEYLKDILQQYNIDPIVIDCTHGQMSQVKVVKVFIPELVQPHIGAYPYLGNPRIYELPVKMGLRDKPLTFEDLKLGPVPFP
jgi:ribosomal protein S12 methylthiotransferase accessory factor